MSVFKKWVLLLSFFACIMRCTIDSAEFWRLNEENTSHISPDIKSILLLSDSHCQRKINIKQLEDLLFYLRTKKTEISLIVEDPNTLNDQKLSWLQLGELVKSYSTPIRNSVSLAHHCHILASSVEFRPDTSRFYFPVVTIENIIDTTGEQVKQIAQYDDGPVLNKEYKKYVERYNSIIAPNSRQLFKNIAAQDCSLEDINYDLLEYPKEANNILHLYEPFYGLNRKSLEDRVSDVITDYAQEAINFKILHALFEHAKHGVKQVVIYAGGAHINAIKPVLKKLGYCFYQYADDIEYDDDGHLSPIDVAKMFKKFDPTYDPNQELPKETIDYFFEYKEAEARNPWFGARLRIKLFTALADSCWGEKACKGEGLSWVEKGMQAALSVGIASAVLCVLKACCKPN